MSTPSTTPPAAKIWERPGATCLDRSTLLLSIDKPLDAGALIELRRILTVAQKGAGREVVVEGQADVLAWLPTLCRELALLGATPAVLPHDVRGGGEDIVSGTCLLSVWFALTEPEWSARRLAFRQAWKGARKQQVPPAAAIVVGSNPVGMSAGRVSVRLENDLDDQAALYIGPPGNKVRLSLDAGSDLAWDAAHDCVRLRFRPGALEPLGSAPGDAPAPGWVLSWEELPDHTRQVTLAPEQSIPASAGPWEWILGGLVPGSTLGGRAVRVEVEWSASRRGVHLSGVRSLHLPVMVSTAHKIAAALGGLEGTGTTLERVQTAAQSVQSTLAGHQTSLDAMNAGAAALGSTVSGHRASLDAMNAGVAALGSTVSGHRANLETMYAGVGPLGSTLAVHQSTFTTLAGALPILGSTLDAAGGRIGSLSDQHNSVTEQLLQLIANDGDDRFEFWVQGSPRLAPSLPAASLSDNRLCLRVRNRTADSFNNLTFSVDFGDRLAVGLATCTGTWTLNPDATAPTDVHGVSATERKVPTLPSGAVLQITLANLDVPEGTALGRYPIRLRYYATPSTPPSAALCERVQPNTVFQWAQPVVATNRSWTVEMRVKITQVPTGDWTWGLSGNAVNPEYAMRAMVRSGRLYVAFSGGFWPINAAQMPAPSADYLHVLGTFSPPVGATEGQFNMYLNGEGTHPIGVRAIDTSIDRVGAFYVSGGAEGRIRDVRIWNRVLTGAEIKASAAGHAPSRIAPGLLIDMPLDDVGTTPRNHARLGRGPQPLALSPVPPLPPAGATRPDPIVGTLEVAVNVSSIRELSAGEVRISGDLRLDRGSTARPGALTAAGGLTAASASLSGALTAASANVTGLLVSGTHSTGTVIGEAAKSTVKFRFSRDQFATACRLTVGATAVTTGSSMTYEARFLWPLPTPPGDWSTLFRGPTALHHALVHRGDNRLGAYFGGQFHDANYNMAGLSKGEHHLAVVKVDTTLKFFLDGAWVGTELTLADTVKNERVETIGSLMDGTQSFGPVWDIKVWTSARTADQLGTSVGTPALWVQEGSELPTGVSWSPAMTSPTDFRSDSGRLVPPGTIVMWAGSLAAIPKGWFLCDGSLLSRSTLTPFQTPDLRDRMIRGTGNGPGRRGGSDTVTLTEHNLPSHSHGYNDIYYSEAEGTVDVELARGSNKTDYDNRGLQMHRTTDPAGGGLPFSILPAYYELAFIVFVPDADLG